MARPKTVEEWKILEELKKKYEQEGVMGMAPINKLYYDQEDETSWKELAQIMESVFHY